MSNYDYYKAYPEMKDIIAFACEAEDIFPVSYALASFDCRRSLEQAVKWVYQKENIQKQYGDTLKNMIDNSRFIANIPSTSYNELVHIIRTGNKTAHETSEITKESALLSMRNLYNFIKYLGIKYYGAKPTEEYSEDFANKKEAKQPLSAGLSSSLFDYIWALVAERLKTADGIKPLKPHLCFCDYNIGIKNAHLAVDLKNKDRKIRMQLYIRNNEPLYEKLKNNQAYLEEQLEVPMFFTTSDTGDAHRIGYWIDDIDFTENNAGWIADSVTIGLNLLQKVLCETIYTK